jgi:hypothetical protein
MTLTSPRGLSAIAIALLLCSTALLAQDQYDSRTLEVKLRFGKGVLQAINEPFAGVGELRVGPFSTNITCCYK